MLREEGAVLNSLDVSGMDRQANIASVVSTPRKLLANFLSLLVRSIQVAFAMVVEQGGGERDSHTSPQSRRLHVDMFTSRCHTGLMCIA